MGVPQIGDPQIGDPQIGDPQIGDPKIRDPQIRMRHPQKIEALKRKQIVAIVFLNSRSKGVVGAKACASELLFFGDVAS